MVANPARTACDLRGTGGRFRHGRTVARRSGGVRCSPRSNGRHGLPAFDGGGARLPESLTGGTRSNGRRVRSKAGRLADGGGAAHGRTADGLPTISEPSIVGNCRRFRWWRRSLPARRSDGGDFRTADRRGRSPRSMLPDRLTGGARLNGGRLADNFRTVYCGKLSPLPMVANGCRVPMFATACPLTGAANPARRSGVRCSPRSNGRRIDWRTVAAFRRSLTLAGILARVSSGVKRPCKRTARRDGREPVRHGRTQRRAVAARFRRN